jgi:DNA invertase Pin-like site-specific DNA recombinase
MNNIRKVSRIDKQPIKWKLNVAAYCRVSTPHAEQIESLSNQVEYYKQMVSKHIDWILVDIYADIKSGKSTSKKPEFQRMLKDSNILL